PARHGSIIAEVAATIAVAVAVGEAPVADPRVGVRRPVGVRAEADGPVRGPAVDPRVAVPRITIPRITIPVPEVARVAGADADRAVSPAPDPDVHRERRHTGRSIPISIPIAGAVPGIAVAIPGIAQPGAVAVACGRQPAGV